MSETRIETTTRPGEMTAERFEVVQREWLNAGAQRVHHQKEAEAWRIKRDRLEKELVKLEAVFLPPVGDEA